MEEEREVIYQLSNNLTGRFVIETMLEESSTAEAATKAGEQSPPDSPPQIMKKPRRKNCGAAKYSTRFNEEWTKRWPFIQPGREPTQFKCTACDCLVSCSHQGKTDVMRHMMSRKHCRALVQSARLKKRKRMEFRRITQLKHKLAIKTVEMHTGGEAVRIVISGYPEIKGDTILEKRRYVRENYDHIRRMLMAEPRGHSEMYGAILVEPDLADADLAVLFTHNEGYSTMCGHATISLGRFAIDYGVVPIARSGSETVVRLQCPCGLVTAHVECKDGSTGRVRFESVPCFVFRPDIKIAWRRGQESVRCDVVYGGAFYVHVDAAQLGLDLTTSSSTAISQVAMEFKEAVAVTVSLSHPQYDDVAFLYGVVLYTAPLSSRETIEQLIVFADGQIDRSPCGSGTCGSLTLLHHKHLLKFEESRSFVNAKTRSCFTGKLLREVDLCGRPAFIAEVAGNGHYMGENTFYIEESDTVTPFLVK